MKQALYTYVIWILVTLLQAAIAVLMYRRDQHKEFPAFFGYTVFHVVQSVVSFIANFASYDAYFYVYWGSEVIDAVVTLIVLQEVFSKVLQPYDALRRVGSGLFRWSTVGLCLIALVSAAFAPGNHSQPLMRGLFAMERSIEFLKAGLMLFLFVFSRLFGLGWRDYVFGIALGFGLVACIGLIGSSMASHFGTAHQPLYKFLIGKSFAVGVLVWSYYFLYKKSRVPTAQLAPSEQLQEWNEALAGLLNK